MTTVVITGAGIVSAIGTGKRQTLDALLHDRSGISNRGYLGFGLPMGVVSSLEDDGQTPRTAVLGRSALKEAMEEAGIWAEEAAFINGTTVGCMDVWERQAVEQGTPENRLKALSAGHCTELIAREAGHFAWVTTPSTACSAALNAIILGARLIESGRFDTVVAGGAECLTHYHVSGFNTLMILDPNPCRPFDNDRAGLNLGEGAAYLVLESEAHARKRGARLIGRLCGWGNACDAFHQTATSPEGDGATLAMEAALRRARLRAADIQYINAHGTGTPDNDLSESHAIRRVFGERIPPVSSTKALTGHTTSASGAIEAVICLLCLREQFVPGQQGFHTPMEDGIIPVLHTGKAELRHVLCNAFGFGGNDSAVILGRAEESAPVDGTVVSKERYTPYVKACLRYDGEREPKVRLNPMKTRRLGKGLKGALQTALDVLAEGSVTHPDAIITGTASGCMDNTRKFFTALHTDEGLASPASFMQSTHNTVSALVAIQTGSHGYNSTYSHDAVSAASAWADAFLQLQAGEIMTALVGGYDELQDGTPDCQYTLLCNDASEALCRVLAVRLLHEPDGKALHAAMEEIASLADGGPVETFPMEETDTVVRDLAGGKRAYALLEAADERNTALILLGKIQ